MAWAQGRVRGQHFSVYVYLLVAQGVCVCGVHFPGGFPSVLWLTRPRDTTLSWMNASALSFSVRILLFHPKHNDTTGLVLRTPTHVYNMWHNSASYRSIPDGIISNIIWFIIQVFL